MSLSRRYSVFAGQRLRLGLLLAALLSIFSPVAAAQEIEFEVSREGEFIIARASVNLPVARSLVWDVVTDYGRLAEFIPDMDYSRIVSRSPDGVVLAQKGRYGLLFYSQDIDVRLAVVESPPSTVVSRLISGNMRDMSGRYDLTENGSGTRLVYQGRILPQAELPPLVGMAVLRLILRRQFAAMVDEIGRRSARELARSSPAS